MGEVGDGNRLEMTDLGEEAADKCYVLPIGAGGDIP